MPPAGIGSNFPVNSPEPSPETSIEMEPSPNAAVNSSPSLSPEPDASMQEYHQLQMDLLKLTLFLTGIVFISVWIFYSLNIALNYLIGASTGVVYLRMLARNVEQLGRQRKQLGSTRLVLLIAIILVASRWNQLQIMPIFLGFLTYKAAVIFYMLKTAIVPD